MVQLNLALREINCKVVYFGCGLGGKTTNLEVVHQKAAPESRGDLTSIATESDRTLFFDFMPLDLGTVSGMRVKFQLYTVPGQVYYNSTRKLVLRGADGVIFVADSQASKQDENVESLENLEECLKEQGRALDEMPHVIQFNKRDLEDILSIEEMSQSLNRYGAPVFGAIASAGDGVLETFKALASVMLERVKSMSTESSAKAGQAPPRRMSARDLGAPPARDMRLQGGLASSPPPTAAAKVEDRLVDRPAGAASRPATAEARIARETGGSPVVDVGSAEVATADHVRPSTRSVPREAEKPSRREATSGSMPRMETSMMMSKSRRRRPASNVKKVLFGLLVLALAAAGVAAFFLIRS